MLDASTAMAVEQLPDSDNFSGNLCYQANQPTVAEHRFLEFFLEFHDSDHLNQASLVVETVNFFAQN